MTITTKFAEHKNARIEAVINERNKAIAEAVRDLSNGEAIDIHNEYCEAVNDCDSMVYSMYDLDDLLYGKKPTEIIDLVDGDFNTACEYFCWTIYGLESFDFIENSSVYYPEDIISEIINSETAFGCCAIENILEEYQEKIDEIEAEDEDEDSEE